MPYVNRSKLTLSVDSESTNRFDTLKRLYGFKSRGKFFDNLINYIYSLELVRLTKSLSPELQDRVARQVVNHFAKYGKARLEVE